MERGDGGDAAALAARSRLSVLARHLQVASEEGGVSRTPCLAYESPEALEVSRRPRKPYHTIPFNFPS